MSATSPLRDPKRTRRRAERWCALSGGVLFLTAFMIGCGHGSDNEGAERNSDPTPGDSAMRYVGTAGGGPSANTQRQAQGGPRIIPAVEPAPKPTQAMTFEESCITEACHATYLTAPQIHGPIAAENCSSCHDTDAGNHTFPLKREGNKTCTFCHLADTGRIHRHEAIDEEDGCLSCHQPHISQAKFLLTAATTEAVCVSCHPKDEGRFAHGPFAAGECAACHEPHQSNYVDLLRGGSGPDHCFMCHAETKYAIENAPFVHEPTANDCTACHSAHASNYPDHLNLPIERLCFDCHENLEQQVTGAMSPHAAVFTEKRCANCHDPHASGRARLLRARQTELCLECHNEPIRANDGHMIPDMTASVTERRFLHGPVESGDCAACHNVHGSSHARLLRENFPKEFYTRFELESYALCFTCHPKELVLSERTTSLTDFRDGDLNLHYLHVHRNEKGRTCKACHAIHGSDLPKHVATNVPFEGSEFWLMPTGFEQTDDGGSCAPGCHAAESYSRENESNSADSPPQGDGP